MNFKTLKNKSYRIALLGTTDSGKTCILAELAMNHGSNKRLMSNQIPLDFAPLTDEEKERIDTDEQIRLRWNFQRGQESLDEAKKRLGAGERPNATIRGADVRPMLEYVMGDADGRGDFYVWTEDYSGELINPAELEADDSEAKRLRERLLKYDGLILVVDTAVTKEQETTALKQIEMLCSSFTSLANIVSDDAFSRFPVAVVLSKWDRYASPIEFDSPQTEREKLERYLNEHSYYNRLIRAIRSNAQNQEATPTGDLMAGIAYGNTAVFPVSAFGNAVTDPQNGECPDKACLQSFGLVEPFFWIACRCDEIKIVQLENRIQKINVFWTSGLCGVKKEAKKQCNLIASATPTKQRYKKVLSDCFYKQLRNRFIWFTLILFVCWFALNFYWYLSMSRVYMDSHAPTATAEKLSEARECWKNYKLLPYKTLIVFPTTHQADDELKFIDNQIDDLYWKPVEAAEGLATKAKLAQDYLDKYPNGRHAVDARKIILEYECYKDDKAWERVENEKDLATQAELAKKYLEEFDKNGTALHRDAALAIIQKYKIWVEETTWKRVLDAPKNSVIQIELAKDYLKQYPNGIHAQEALDLLKEYEIYREDSERKRYINAPKDTVEQMQVAQQYLEKYPNGRYATEAQNTINRIIDIFDTDKMLANYDETLKNNSISNSIEILRNIIRGKGTKNEKVQQRIKDLPDKIKEKIDVQSREKSAFEMIKICDDTYNTVLNFEQFLRSKEINGNDWADVLLHAMQTQPLTKFRKAFIDKYDKELYSKFLENKTLKTCSAYLQGMETFEGSGAMKSEVEKYQNYLNHENDPLKQIDLEIYVDWGPKARKYYVEGKIYLNGTLLMYDDKTLMEANAHTILQGVRKMTGFRPSSNVKFKVDFIYNGNTFPWDNNKKSAGTGEKSFSLSELLSEKGGVINLDDDYSNQGKVTIKASSPNLMKKPETPAWTTK